MKWILRKNRPDSRVHHILPSLFMHSGADWWGNCLLGLLLSFVKLIAKTHDVTDKPRTARPTFWPASFLFFIYFIIISPVPLISQAFGWSKTTPNNTWWYLSAVQAADGRLFPPHTRELSILYIAPDLSNQFSGMHLHHMLLLSAEGLPNSYGGQCEM